MATRTLPLPRPRWDSQKWARRANELFHRSRPFRRGIADHWLTVTGFGFISGAFFQLSTFWGLLVTGTLFIVFELKVGE